MSVERFLAEMRAKGLDPQVGPAARLPTVPPPAGESEAAFQTRVIEFAQGHGWAVAHFRRVKVQRADGSVYFETPVAADGKGFLDLECVRERLVKVELKVGRNTPTDEQLAWLDRYKRAGVEAHVFYPADWPVIETTFGG